MNIAHLNAEPGKALCLVKAVCSPLNPPQALCGTASPWLFQPAVVVVVLGKKQLRQLLPAEIILVSQAWVETQFRSWLRKVAGAVFVPEMAVRAVKKEIP